MANNALQQKAPVLYNNNLQGLQQPLSSITAGNIGCDFILEPFSLLGCPWWQQSLSQQSRDLNPVTNASLLLSSGLNSIQHTLRGSRGWFWEGLGRRASQDVGNPAGIWSSWLEPSRSAGSSFWAGILCSARLDSLGQPLIP